MMPEPLLARGDGPRQRCTPEAVHHPSQAHTGNPHGPAGPGHPSAHPSQMHTGKGMACRGCQCPSSAVSQEAGSSPGQLMGPAEGQPPGQSPRSPLQAAQQQPIRQAVLVEIRAPRFKRRSNRQSTGCGPVLFGAGEGNPDSSGWAAFPWCGAGPCLLWPRAAARAKPALPASSGATATHPPGRAGGDPRSPLQATQQPPEHPVAVQCFLGRGRETRTHQGGWHSHGVEPAPACCGQ